MSLLLDALRRAEQAKRELQTEQEIKTTQDSTTVKDSIAAPSAGLMLESDEDTLTVTKEVQAAMEDDNVLTLSLVEEIPSTTEVTNARQNSDAQDLSSKSGSSSPVTTPSMSPAQMVSQLQMRRRLAARTGKLWSRSTYYMAGGGIALLVVVLGLVYFKVFFTAERLSSQQVAGPLLPPSTQSLESVAEYTAPELVEAKTSSTNGTDTKKKPVPLGTGLKASMSTGKTGTLKTITQSKQVKPIGSEISQASAASIQTKQATLPLVIVHNQTEDPLQVLLEHAFDDYQAGDYQRANNGYRKVLIQDPNNRDALLGLAAIAQRYGEIEEARLYYRRLLALNPMDSAPIAALISLNHGSNPLQDESQIKLLLKQEPTAAHLYFALGTLYVEQERWSEAQQAYFNAYHHNPVNADYAFNLAVLLDRLGQSEAAMNYYQRALELAHGRAVSFKETDVEQRIMKLVTTARGNEG